MVPTQGIETAVTRRYPGGQDPNGKPDSTWIPQECLSLEQAIAAYTREATFALFLEKDLGTIEKGKRADLVALDDAGNVRFSMVGGKIAFNDFSKLLPK